MDEILSTLLLITVSNLLTKGKGNFSETFMKFWLILVFFCKNLMKKFSSAIRTASTYFHKTFIKKDSEANCANISNNV